MIVVFPSETPAGFSAAQSLPLVTAYFAICASWLALNANKRRFWPMPPMPVSARPKADFVLALVAVAGVLGIGQLYHRDLLLARGSAWTYQLNTLLIWAPLFVVLALRRAPLGTVFLNREGWGRKLAVGAATGLLGIFVLCSLQGAPQRTLRVLIEACEPRALKHLLPVLLEGVGVAFLYVRLRWLTNRIVALLGPCLLFAIAHVPRQLADGNGSTDIALMLLLNTFLTLAILATVVRSRDVLWIGVAHYLMDVAIDAFA